MLALRSVIVLAVVLLLGLAGPARAGDPAASAIEREFTGLLNEERAARGLAPVEISPSLTEIADDYAAYNDQVGDISHDRDPPYTSRARASGCSEDSWDGPVLHGGNGSAREVLDSWLSSSGHADVLLDPDITHLGPGFGEDNRLAYGLPCPASELHSSGDFGGFSGGPAARTLSLRYSSRGHFKGKVVSAEAACSAGVSVEVLRMRRGSESIFGTDRTNAGGGFKVLGPARRGKYVARVSGSECALAESELIRVSG